MDGGTPTTKVPLEREWNKNLFGIFQTAIGAIGLWLVYQAYSCDGGPMRTKVVRGAIMQDPPMRLLPWHYALVAAGATALFAFFGLRRILLGIYRAKCPSCGAFVGELAWTENVDVSAYCERNGTKPGAGTLRYER